MTDEQTANEQTAGSPSLDFGVEEQVTGEQLESLGIQELRIAGLGPLRSDYCGDDAKGVVAEVRLAEDRSFDVSVRADVLTRMIIRKVVGDCIAEFLEQHKHLEIGCVGYTFELSLFEGIDLCGVQAFWMQILQMVNGRTGGEYVGHTYSYEPELLQESPLVYSYMPWLVVVCERRVDLTKLPKGETLAAMAELGRRADVIKKLETESFGSLSEVERKLTVDLASTLITHMPMQQLLDVFDGAELTPAKRRSIATFAGDEAGRMVRLLNKTFGMTYREIGEAIGKGHGTVGRYASGETAQPRPEVIEKLSNLVTERRSRVKGN